MINPLINPSYLVPPIVASVASFVLAAVVWYGNRQRSFSNQLFTGILLTIGVWGLLLFAMRASPDVQRAVLWDRALPVATLATFVLFYHFTLAYTDTRGKRGILLTFYLILAAVRKVSLNIFWRILAGSLVMVVSGFLGELDYINSLLGFVIAVAAWIYVLYEIYSGEAGEMVAKSGNKSLVTAYSAMRIIVTIGWAIYPLGYVFSYLTGSGSLDSNSLNIIYNLADFINKIAFGLIIYACAVFNTSSRTR